MRASIAAVAVVLGSPLPALCAGELALVGDGKALAQIVVPASTVPSVECAARELQHHVRKATGVALPIRSEPEHTPPRRTDPGCGGSPARRREVR